MKELYTAPAATVITLAAVEKLAVLNNHPGDPVTCGGDVVGGKTSVVQRPGVGGA